MMCFEYKEIEKNMDIKNKISELSIEATIENLEKVEEFIDENLDKCNFYKKRMSQIKISVEEIYVNIAHYAYSPNTGMAKISVDINQDDKYMEIVFIDQGKPYNPLEKKDPDVKLKVSERQMGGLGIYMTKKLMDDISYEYKDGQNILRIKKLI
jgi:anti-sigma regulatory factor (Ser/Thr protein kinase)